MLPGKIATLLVLATVLSVIAALVVGNRYRAAMQRLMQAAPPARPPADTGMPAIAPIDAGPLAPPRPLTVADNQQAYRQLLAAFLALTLVMALTRTFQTQIAANGPITIKTVLTLCAAYAWPVVPVIAVIDRWRRRRLVGTLFLWFVAAVALLTWRTNEHVSFAQVLFWLSLDIGLPLIVVTALCLGGVTRAVGPWLAPMFILLCWASQAGVDLLQVLIDQRSPVVSVLLRGVSPIACIALFAIAPWLIAWWPAKLVSRWLAEAHQRRQISELFYLFTAVWVIALTGSVLGAIASEGWGALLDFLPLLWIPLGARVIGATVGQRPGGRPPTLLVLRVFRQDAHVQALFDRVIDRWRLTGNTVLIAGTDLADRTIDPDDIFTFLDGRLAERFVLTPADLGPRLDSFELRPDLDGRYRVNECYCHDTTWQLALAALLRRSDVVLMDLRNFIAANRGCVYELQTLATQPDLQRVVVLTNDRTELAAAQAATADAPAGRFVWLPVPDSTQPDTDTILAPLFTATPGHHPR